MRKLCCLFLSLTLTLSALNFTAPSSALADTRPAPEDRGASGLALALRRLQTIASVLHTAAHPDDESSDLLAYLARGEGARVAYLSLNRGEGGQNSIGPELWESLGVLRTEELLAARRIDGAEQYFTRAFDFGFTKSVPETLQKWNKEEIIGDMVRVIRTLRPLVVVNGWSGTQRDGHGQHQVAGLLTPEAIKAAADPQRFPDQLKEGLQPWQVLKVYGRVFGEMSGPGATINVGQFDPVLGRSTSELAAEGRSKHRSQDFGGIQMRGSVIRYFPRLESKVEAPEKEQSLFEGLDVSITGIAKFAGADAARLLPQLARIKELAAQAQAEYRPQAPTQIAPKLAEGLREVRVLRRGLNGSDLQTSKAVDGLLERKEAEFSDALARAYGVVVDALSTAEVVAPGEKFEVNVNVYVGAQTTGASGWELPEGAISLVAATPWEVKSVAAVAEQQASPVPFFRGREVATRSARYQVSVPADEPPTQPYWMTEPRTRDQFNWTDRRLPVTLPFAPPKVVASVKLKVAGEMITLRQPAEYRFADKTFGEIRRELKVVPALTVTLRPSLMVIPQGGSNAAREVSVEVINNARRALTGTLKLVAPTGWKVEGDGQPLAFAKQNEKASRQFRVTPPAGASGNFELKAVAEADGQSHASGYTTIAHPHIETHFIYRPATAKAEVFDVKVAAGLRVGYVAGSGDDIPEALGQLGVNVQTISETELASGDLSGYDTIILGIRVYEVREDVIANNKRLLDYVRNGGTLVVQYNKNEFGRGNFAPYPVEMAGSLRVTDETAPVTILQPNHPRFNFPNKITDADWQGWVQERGLYFLSKWDEHYTPLLASADPGEQQLRGGELIAQYGKGTYVFSSYAWFRQLPAGVSGAYRLFANLISLPKAK